MYKIFLFLVLSVNLFAQHINLQELDKEIYENNNNGKYKESQEKLNNLIGSNKYSNTEKVFFNIYLSYTYKRLFDYKSALLYLENANQLANRAEQHKDSIQNLIVAERAYILFDTNKYNEADSLMKILNQKKYKHIDADNLAKLQMQEAYILYLNKMYQKAALKYDQALNTMRSIGSCNTPMILVKQMQLYDAMDQTKLRDSHYKMAMDAADSCHITKYKMYATEELLNLFTKRKDLKKAFIYQYKFDSLKIAYNLEGNLSTLHNNKAALIASEKDSEIKNKTWIFSGLILLFLGLLALVYWRLLVYRAEKNRAEIELNNMRAELNNFTESYYLSHKSNAEATAAQSNNTNTNLEGVDQISERQQEVLTLLHKGLSNKEIAEKLFISENTVKYHIRNIYAILNLSDRRDIIKYLSKDT